MSSGSANLEAAVQAVDARIGLARAVRFGAVGLGLGALLAWMGLPFAFAFGLLAVVGWFTRPGLAESARRLDRALAAEDAVVCAWDHRAKTEPMAAALRRRVESRLTPMSVRAAAPAPALAWALGPLLGVLPVLRPGVGPIEIAAPELLPATVDAGAQSPMVSVPSEGRPAPRPDGGTRVAAQGDRPDGGGEAASDGGAPGGEVAAQTEVGGEGTQAGDRRAVPVAAERIGLSPGTAAGIWLARAGGEALPGTAPRATAPIRGRTPAEDDISDPARPFEPRYRPLIAAWFRRGR